jgi:hypothetical protein
MPCVVNGEIYRVLFYRFQCVTREAAKIAGLGVRGDLKGLYGIGSAGKLWRADGRFTGVARLERP